MLIAITGPAGSGKSTTAKELVKKFPKGVNIDMDEVKHFVCTGFKYDDSPEGLAQWRLLGSNISDLINNFVSDGYEVIVNGYVDSVTWQLIHKKHQFDVEILLYPRESINLSRDKERSEEIVMGEKDVLRHRTAFEEMDFYKGWRRYDFSDKSVEQAVDILVKDFALLNI